MKNAKVRGLVVDPETGEKIDEIREGDSIVRSESKEKLKETVFLNEDEPFLKVYTKAMFDVSRSLDGMENQLMNMLMHYISYETGILKFANGIVLTRQHVIELAGLNYKTVDKHLKRLVDIGVFGKHKTGRNVNYIANPYIFMRGKKVNKTLKELFKNTKWAKNEKQE